MAKSVMKNSLLRKKRSLFYTRNEPWWLIGFSMLMAGGVLTEPQMLTAFLLNKNLSGMWLVWSVGIGTSFGMVFFGHLWRRVPVKTENELLLYRFSGAGARWLHVFRSLYVGGIVVPLLLGMAFLAFARVLEQMIGISFEYALMLILLFLGLGTFFNSLRKRIRLDFIYSIIFIVALILLFVFLHNNLGSIADIKAAILSSDIQFRLFPEIGTVAFTSFLVFVFIQWWAANIIDLPSTEGQKLMAAKNINTVSKSIVLPRIFFALFLILISIMPFYVLLVEPEFLIGFDDESAFVTIFNVALSGYEKWVAVIFFGIPFLVISHNLQNWSGALLIQNFYKHYVQPGAGEKHLFIAGQLAMLFVLIFSLLIAFYSDSVLGITKYILTITAGVGPVFILRWYWHRINAWAQLTAMVFSLILPTLYDYLFMHSVEFSSTVNFLMDSFRMDYFPLKLVVLSILVVLVWMIVMSTTPRTSQKQIRTFANQVKPGGIWPVKNAGNIYFFRRLFIALLLSGNFVLIYVILWKIVNGQYWFSILLFFAHVLTMLFAYHLLQKLNLKNG